MQTTTVNHAKAGSPKEEEISARMPAKKTETEKLSNATGPTPALQIESSVPPQPHAEAAEAEDWNSLQPIAREGTAPEATLMTTSESVKALEKSFSAMVMAFLISCLDIFSSLQKAQMTMAFRQLDIMVSQIKEQIAELKEEQKQQLFKDCFQAGTEMAGAIIATVGSAKTTIEMNVKLDLQKANATNMKGAMTNEKIDQLQVKAEAMNAQAKNAAKTSNGVADDLLQNADTNIDSLAHGTTRVKTEVGKINADAPLKDAATYKANGEQLASEVHFINNKQSLINSISGLVKAFGPLIGTNFSNQATGHQIKSKEAETAKEITSNQYRILMELLSAYRDAFSKILSCLQEVLSQDPANSKASSQRMA